jgi:hypothetical protein
MVVKMERLKVERLLIEEGGGNRNVWVGLGTS